MGGAIAVTVAEAVADANGVAPTELEYALDEYIDTDALEQLVTHETASWTLSFELPEHNVTVTSDGLILVDGARQETFPSP